MTFVSTPLPIGEQESMSKPRSHQTVPGGPGAVIPRRPCAPQHRRYCRNHRTPRRCCRSLYHRNRPRRRGSSLGFPPHSQRTPAPCRRGSSPSPAHSIRLSPHHQASYTSRKRYQRVCRRHSPKKDHLCALVPPWLYPGAPPPPHL